MQNEEGATTGSPEGGWQHVPSDETAADASLSPSSPSGVPDTGRRRRRRGPARAAEPVPPKHRALVIGLVISALLVAVAAGGGYLASRMRPAETHTETQVVTKPPFKMELPLEIGEYSRDANDGNSPTTSADGKQTVSATYSKGGQPAFVLLVARPYSQGKVFMRDLNMNVITPVEDGLCGISGDNKNDGCSVIRANTGILVLATVDLSRADLMGLTRQAADMMDR